MKNRAYIPAGISLLVALGMHYAGNHWHIYTLISWYDDPLHFLSGLGLGFFFYWFISEFDIIKGGLRGMDLWVIVGLVLICGTVWECFEVITDTAGYPIGSVAYVVDTTKDIVNGVVGSIAALIIISETFEKKNNENKK
ncbi:MAG: hypothetical protein KGJ35_00900 [Patescibacteria group bacterium]|nr:hypothetical protein [Patescibacteria group bacterium]